MHAYLICKSDTNNIDVKDFVPNAQNIIEHRYGKIKIEDVRDLNSILFTKGVETHVVYFDNFLDVAQNAFLKTLEEPANEKTIILITKSKSTLLDTLLSRLIIIENNSNAIKTGIDGQKFLDLSIVERLEHVNKILDLEHDDVRPEAQKLLASLIDLPNLDFGKRKELTEMYDYLFDSGSSAKQILEFVAVTL